jgi:hypothetical protein
MDRGFRKSVGRFPMDEESERLGGTNGQGESELGL